MNMQKDQKFLNNTLTVDCGLHTGWAYWDGTNKPKTGSFQCASSVKGMKLSHFDQRNILSEYLYNLIWMGATECIHISKIYLEGTQQYASVVSQTAISKGSLFELSYLVGRYEAVAEELKIKCEIINAPQWKGQMSKEITAQKIKMINGMEYPSEHIMDAVGMGFGIVGAFTWEIRKE